MNPNVIMNSSVNLTSSHTEEEERSDLDFVLVIFTSLILGLMILTTIIGKEIIVKPDTRFLCFFIEILSGKIISPVKGSDSLILFTVDQIFFFQPQFLSFYLTFNPFHLLSSYKKLRN